MDSEKYKIETSLISADEMLELDNNWEDIVRKYTRELIAAKEQAFSQYIMKKQQDEIDRLRKDVDNLVAQRKRNEKSRRKQQKAMVRIQNNWNYIKDFLKDKMSRSFHDDIYEIVLDEMLEVESKL